MSTTYPFETTNQEQTPAAVQQLAHLSHIETALIENARIEMSTTHIFETINQKQIPAKVQQLAHLSI